jgi:hypothetical protein
MVTTATRNRLVIAAATTGAALFLAWQMFFSLTPPRHADHDHAMATLDAGGFLRVEGVDSRRRNLVGRPGRVLVLHWFRADATVQREAVAADAFAAAAAADPAIEVLLVAAFTGEATVAALARTLGIDPARLYLDRDGKVADLIGVRRFPETLVYDPAGRLAHQARGPADWSPHAMLPLLAKAKAGVAEIH